MAVSIPSPGIVASNRPSIHSIEESYMPKQLVSTIGIGLWRCMRLLRLVRFFTMGVMPQRPRLRQHGPCQVQRCADKWKFQAGEMKSDMHGRKALPQAEHASDGRKR